MEELNLNKTEEQNPIKVKKLYNPFKMRGSWIGLTMALFYSFTYGTSSLGIPLIFNIFIGWIFYPVLYISAPESTMGPGGNCTEGECMLQYAITKMMFFPYGFLMGWAVHSLFRKIGEYGRK